MKVIIDTNVVIDVYQNRQPFAESSKTVLKLSESGKITGIITANMVTDIYYILAKHIKDNEHVKTLVRKLLEAVDIADVTANDVFAALELHMPDFEDALVAQCAKRLRTTYIITRNTKDFVASPIQSISPDDFLERCFTD